MTVIHEVQWGLSKVRVGQTDTAHTSAHCSRLNFSRQFSNCLELLSNTHILTINTGTIQMRVLRF
jgi:hypothetical protein